MYLTIVLFNTAATAVYLVLSSKVMKECGLSPGATIASVHLAAAVLLVLLAAASGQSFLPPASALAMGWLVATSALKLLSKQMTFFAYKRTDVANVTVFASFIPIFTMALGFLMLGEAPSALELIGTVIVCASLYFLFLQPGDGKTGAARLLSPFAAMKSPPILCAFLSTVPIALSSVYMKKSALVLGELHFAIISTFLIGLSAGVIEWARPAAPPPPGAGRRLPFVQLVVIAAVFASAQYSFVILITMEKIAHTVAFQPLGIVFQMLLAYVILREREHPIRRLAYGTCIVVGTVLLELGRLRG